MSVANDQIFELRLRSDVSELVRMDHWVLHVADRLQLRDDIVHAISLCLTEAVTNVIAYGGADPDIVVSIRGLRDVVTAHISDRGRPFDPLSHKLDPLPASLEEARIGGHGIRLIRKFASSLSYKREAGRNSLTMTFDR